MESAILSKRGSDTGTARAAELYFVLLTLKIKTMGCDSEGTGYSPEIREEMMRSENRQSTIKNERDYAIRKGKVLERFKEGFFERFMHNALYRNVYEALIRDADPYDIIEKLIVINDEQFQKIKELVELMPPQRIMK